MTVSHIFLQFSLFLFDMADFVFDLPLLIFFIPLVPLLTVDVLSPHSYTPPLTSIVSVCVCVCARSENHNFVFSMKEKRNTCALCVLKYCSFNHRPPS